MRHEAIRIGFTQVALAAVALTTWSVNAHADAVTDWNVKAGEIIAQARLGTPPAVRVMAIVQTAVYEAVSDVTSRYPDPARGSGHVHGVSVDAAVAAANRIALRALARAQAGVIEAAYEADLARLPDGPAKSAGIAMGEKAALAVLARRADDGAGAPEAYRPHTTAAAYVPTVTPAVPNWGQREPWLMKSPAEFRPAPPPDLTSEQWARDYNEVKALGSRASARRTAEQTEIARFWEFSLPPIYYGVVRSVADRPGREVTRNARLYAAVSQAMDDAMISVFDAKYHYNFWRPATAIRNGDLDANAATVPDAAWTPFIDAPMHPEYPSAHTILAAAVAAVLLAEIGTDPAPELRTTSPTANGAVRRWASVDQFVREVADARVYEGIHYRTSTEVGAAMGRRIGGLAVARYLANRQ
jgi:hypothetical protein